jgi:ankyrin repeat protein
LQDAVVREALVTRRDQSGRSLLSRAGNAAMAQALLDAGASGLAVGGGRDDFDRLAGEDRDGVPDVLAAMLAALDDDDEARRARVARVDADGRTLLMGAISGVDVQALLDAGAELDAVDNFGFDAFDFSVSPICNNHDFKAGEESVLAALLRALGSDDARRQRMTRLDSNGRSLLMNVSSDGDARALLNAGARARVWDVDNDGNDALWHAVHRDDPMGCDFLPVLLVAMTATRSVEAVSTRVNRGDKTERTLLMHARTGEDAQALLDAGANVRATDRKGHDAIWYVGELPNTSPDRDFDKLKVLLLALRSGERRQRVSDNSIVFVSFAVWGDATTNLQFLVEQGLDVHARWADGCDLFLYIATKHGCRAQPLLDVLLEKLGPNAREAVMQRVDIQAALPRIPWL